VSLDEASDEFASWSLAGQPSLQHGPGEAGAVDRLPVETLSGKTGSICKTTALVSTIVMLLRSVEYPSTMMKEQLRANDGTESSLSST
jgi:hypothetical protein